MTEPSHIVRNVRASTLQAGDWLLQAAAIRGFEPMRVRHVHVDEDLAVVCVYGQADSGERIVVLHHTDEVRVQRELGAADQDARLHSVGVRPGGHGELARRLREAAHDA